jgi:hypothetical protein
MLVAYAELRTAKRVNEDRPREPGNGRVPQEAELDQGELQAVRGHYVGVRRRHGHWSIIAGEVVPRVAWEGTASPPAPAIQGDLVSTLGPDLQCGEGREVLKLAQGWEGTLAVRVLNVVPVPDVLLLDHLNEPPICPIGRRQRR